jgi:hypothetical protein
MSYTNYVTDIRNDVSSGKRYYVCEHCQRINILDDQEANRKDTKWMLLTRKEVKRLFKILSATLDMSYEETLLYLMNLHEKEKQGIYNTISPAGVNSR